jgi:hypothetical protein
MSGNIVAWGLFDLMLGAVFVLTGVPPLMVIGTLVIAVCMVIPLVMTNEAQP